MTFVDPASPLQRVVADGIHIPDRLVFESILLLSNGTTTFSAMTIKQSLLALLLCLEAVVFLSAFSPQIFPRNRPLRRGDALVLPVAAEPIEETSGGTTAFSEYLAMEDGIGADESTTEAAFWAVVEEVDRAEAMDEPLSGDVPRMLHRIFDADLRHLQLRNDKITTNLTCMQPDEAPDDAGAAKRMNYIFDDSDIKNLPLAEGRKCEGGDCGCACSRNIFPTFCGTSEPPQSSSSSSSNNNNTRTDSGNRLLDTFPELEAFTFNDLATVSAATILQFVRLVERVRRTIAAEYGVPLRTLLPLQAYSRKYVAGSTQQGGGGGEGDFVTLHCDEATHTGYHYSCVIYLSSAGQDFEGGAFVFNDPLPPGEAGEEDTTAAVNANEAETEIKEEEEEEELAPKFNYTALAEKIRSGEYTLPAEDEQADDWLDDVSISMDDYEQADDFDDDLSDEDLESLQDDMRRAGRELTPYYPTRGAAVIFSSGWENLHEVEKITKGTRYAVPCFFTTCPVPDMAYEQMHVGKPRSDEMLADDWLHLLLAHRKESPIESVGRVKELLMKWHLLCTPLDEH